MNKTSINQRGLEYIPPKTKTVKVFVRQNIMSVSDPTYLETIGEVIDEVE